MSAVLAAVYVDDAAAEQVRTLLVADGFPTDRVELTSCRELGQAGIVPKEGVAEKLTQYFGQLFSGGSADPSVRDMQRAVLAGQAVIAVQPRGDVETRRALEILGQGEPVELRAADLEGQTFERAAASHDTPVVTRVGKILAGD